MEQEKVEWLSKPSGISKEAVTRRNTDTDGKKERVPSLSKASTHPPGRTCLATSAGSKGGAKRSNIYVDETNELCSGKASVKKGKFDEKNKPPPVLYPPQSQPFSISDDIALVYFDLETTGFVYPRHITQIAARRQHSDTDVFDLYVKPEVPIEPEAQEITGIAFDEATGQMYKDDNPVHSVSIVQALQEFVAFLKGLGETRVVLLGHNAKNFDCLILLDAARACHLVESLESAVLGFVDTLPVLRQAHRDLKSHSLKNLYEHFFGQAEGSGISAESRAAETDQSSDRGNLSQSSSLSEFDYLSFDSGPFDAEPHDAREDARKLDQIMTRSEEIAPSWLSREVLSDHSFTVDYVQKTLDYRRKKARFVWSWKPLMDQEVVTKYMASKAAGTGLSWNDVQAAYDAGGQEGARALLTQSVMKQDGSGVWERVTKNEQILNSMLDFLRGEKSMAVP